MSIKVVVDSAADIGMEEARAMGITMIPMMINFGEEEYYDGVDLLPCQFYDKLTKSKVLPKTSQVTPFRFEEVFETLTANGDEVIAVTISSKLSGTYVAAEQAAEKFNGKVKVVDSLSAAVGERFLCILALDLIKKGYTLSEIYNNLQEKKNKLMVMGCLETLEYLKKGGRISGAVAFVGGMLNIKPVVRILDGEVKMVGKARGQKKGAELMNSIVEECDIDLDLPFGIIYSGCDESVAHKYGKTVESLFDDKNLPAYAIGSTIGTHVGPGVFGIAYFTK